MIPANALVASESFGDPALCAVRVAAAIAAGLIEAGAPPPDECPLVAPEGQQPEPDVRTLLESLDFDARLLPARALIIVVPAINPHALRQTLAFEIATRARQNGIPAYAVLARPTLERFDARMLDLQTVLLAADLPQLEQAGMALAQLL